MHYILYQFYLEITFRPLNFLNLCYTVQQPKQRRKHQIMYHVLPGCLSASRVCTLFIFSIGRPTASLDRCEGHVVQPWDFAIHPIFNQGYEPSLPISQCSLKL